MMDGDTLPLAIGVIRDYNSISYETAVAEQVREVKAKYGFDSLRTMIEKTHETWTV